MATQPLCPVFVDVRQVTTSKAFLDLSANFFDMAPLALKNRSQAESGERIYVAFAKEDGALDTAHAFTVDRGDVVPVSVPPGMRGLLVQSSGGAPDLEIIVGMTGA